MPDAKCFTKRDELDICYLIVEKAKEMSAHGGATKNDMARHAKINITNQLNDYLSRLLSGNILEKKDKRYVATAGGLKFVETCNKLDNLFPLSQRTA
ncbi:MAG: winged helix-turn-helix domain-containing protein [Candidatus Aenigmatarchaeota archaeon]